MHAPDSAAASSQAPDPPSSPLGPRAAPPSTRRPALALVGLLLLAASACRGGPDRPELLPVPRPDLASLTEAAQAQLAAQRETLDAAIAEPATPSLDLAAAFGEAGRHYQAYELVAAAEPCYRNAIALDSERFDWPYLLAHLQRGAGRGAEAAEQFARATEFDPDSQAAWIWLSRSRLALEDFAGAEAAAEAARRLAPDRAAPLVALARVSSALGDSTRTAELLEQARGLAPEANEINYALGQAYRDLGRVAEAEPLLAAGGGVAAPFEDPLFEGLEDLIQSAGAAINRGTRALALGDASGAEREFRAALGYEPDNVAARVNLGYALARQGQGQAAMAAFLRALELDPEDAMANFNVGSLLTSAGRNEAALTYFERALASDPEHLGARFNLANDLLRLGRAAEAEPHYAALLERDPGNRDAHLMHAVSLMAESRWAEALAALEAGHASLPDDQPIANSLARLLAAAPDPALRDPERALALTDALVQLEASAYNIEARAMALAADGRFEEASVEQTRALDAAIAAAKPELEASLRLNLDRYRAGQPAGGPWTPDDPFRPGLR